MIVVLLATASLSARAQDQDPGGFLVPQSGKGTELELRKPLGPVQWIEGGGFEVDGVHMVAMSPVREAYGITFDTAGTPYLIYQKNREKIVKLQIGSTGIGNQGNTEFDGWPYVLSRNQLLAVNDEFWPSFFKKIQAPTFRQGVRIGGEAAGGSALMAAANAWQGSGWVAGGIATFATFAGWWIYKFRDQLKSSHFELGKTHNWFTKIVLDNVVAYEEIKNSQNEVVDVVLKIQKGKDAPVESVLMSSLKREGKTLPAYGNDSCISYLTKRTLR